jgi:tRNA (Thr-GGU) A37 N-methylase
MCALDDVRTRSLTVSGVDLLHGSNVLDLRLLRSFRRRSGLQTTLFVLYIIC